MKKWSKIFCCILAIAMICNVLAPTLADAKSLGIDEVRFFEYTNRIWDEINAYETQIMTGYTDEKDIAQHIYDYLSDHENVVSLSWEDREASIISFTLDNGCNCVYDYSVSANSDEIISKTEIITAYDQKSSTNDADVLVISPYYGIDGAVTTHYADLGREIGVYTEGTVAIQSGQNATADVCKTFSNYGVVIFDSHGTLFEGKPYLCLTSSVGITAQDFATGRAINGGSWYGVCGDFFEYYNNNLPNSLFWMATCHGIETTDMADALINIGAGAVLGYNDVVSFVYDYAMSETFFDCLRGRYVGDNGEYGQFYNVRNAMEVAKAEHGSFDEHTPEGTCLVAVGDQSWTLGNANPTAANGVEIIPGDISLNNLGILQADVRVTPRGANNYTLTWSTGDASVACVDRYGVVSAVGDGVTTLTVELRDNINGITYNDTVNVTVSSIASLGGAVGDESLNVSSSGNYPWIVNTEMDSGTNRDGMCIASGNSGVANSESAVSITITLEAGDTFSFDWKVSSETYDRLRFFVNGTAISYIAGQSHPWSRVLYTAQTAGSYEFSWTYTKDAMSDRGDDCGYIDAVSVERANAVYAVKFIDGYDGSIIETRMVDGGTRITDFPEVPEHSGYIFVGWSYDGAPINADTDIVARVDSVLLGDVTRDGVITASDALLILRFAVGAAVLDAYQQAAADYNQDGNINASDALLILCNTQAR